MILATVYVSMPASTLVWAVLGSLTAGFLGGLGLSLILRWRKR